MRYLLLVSLLLLGYPGLCKSELNYVDTSKDGRFRFIRDFTGSVIAKNRIEVSGDSLDGMEITSVTFIEPLTIAYCAYKKIYMANCSTSGYYLSATKTKVYREQRVLHHKNAEYRFDTSRLAYFISDTFEAAAVFEGSGTAILGMQDCKFNGPASFTRLSADTLQFENCAFYSDAKIESSPGIKCILFGRLAVPSNYIDMSNIGTAGSPCELYIGDIDVSKLKLNYTDFHLTFDTSIGPKRILPMYELMLRKQKEYGYSDGYQKLDIEFRDYKLAHMGENLQDRFSKLWWNYGYNKEYIFKWTGWAFLILYVVLFLFFSFFINRVYTIDNLKERWDRESGHGISGVRRALIKPWIVLFYSCLIFFGIKLDVSKFKYDSLWAVVFIYVFYLFGFMCIVFIANYVLLK